MGKKDFESNVGLMSEQWQCLKEDLHNGVVEYDDLEKIINDYMFFNRFDNIFNETCKLFEVNMSDIKIMYRGASGEVDLNNYERMIPKIEFAKGNNRMNPPGKAFIYIGILRENKGRDKNTVKKHITRTLLKEIRSPRDSIATMCELQVTGSGKHKKVINICGDSSIPKDEDNMNQYIMKNALDNKKRSVDNQKLNKILASIYFNMFSSDSIFKPIETEEQEVKKYEYAPFHALANYISEQGYAGIIFRSTVHENGTNLVLFDTKDVSVVPNSMEHVQASEYI